MTDDRPPPPWPNVLMGRGRWLVRLDVGLPPPRNGATDIKPNERPPFGCCLAIWRRP